MDKITEKLWDDNEEAFIKLLQIPSTYDKETVSDRMPFGRKVFDALTYMKDVLNKNGFDVKEYGNMAISADFGDGPDGERIDIVSHLDVVEPGDGWTYPPFAAVKKDGRIIGRGTQDMKSGAWLTFLAVKHLRDSGLISKRKLRLVYGSDEERTMDDMKAYVKEAGLPAFAFTPDGTFPITVGEKGAVMFVIRGDIGKDITLEAGIQVNVIPPHAHAFIKGADFDTLERACREAETDAELIREDGGITVKTRGTAAHASRPEEGHSALTDLLHILAVYTCDSLFKRLYTFFSDPYGRNGGFFFDIPPMGKLTVSLGTLEIKDGKLLGKVDCRYPMGVTAEELYEIIKGYFYDLGVTVPYVDRPSLADSESPFVKALALAYRDVTGKEAQMKITGGVSYSKVFGNSVNFGPVLEGDPFVAHEKDEYLITDSMKTALRIYIESIRRLSEITDV